MTCEQHGGPSAYCRCVIAHLETSVSLNTVLASASEIEQHRKPTWYAEAIAACPNANQN